MIMKSHPPVIFLLVKVFLLFNIGSTGFLLLVLIGGAFFDSVSSSFKRVEIVLDVRAQPADTTRLMIDGLSGYNFKQSQNGELITIMPWYTQLLVPFAVLNIPGFELSIPYLIFYCMLCFLFYRIIDATAIESPFSGKNIRRIFWIGYLLILYDIIVAIRFVLLSYHVEHITHNAYRYDGLGPLVHFKVGILVIILAMIYRRGVMIQREQELTV